MFFACVGELGSRPLRRISGAERFFVKIAFARILDPLRARAAEAFEEFFFARAREVYPQYDFARMNDNEFGATLGLN